MSNIMQQCMEKHYILEYFPTFTQLQLFHMSIWIILLCWAVAGLIGFLGGKAIKADRDAAAREGRDPISPELKQKKHWTEDMADPEVRPQRHWTEILDNSDESDDRDDDWEWDRQDDFGDSWDHKEGQ